MNVNSQIARYIPFLKNPYLLTFVFFTTWTAFFDSNNLIHIYELEQREQELKQQKVYYKAQIEVIQEKMKQLSSNPRALEQFAREQYLFQRPGEDVFVIKKRSDED